MAPDRRRVTVVFPGATSPPRDGASAYVRATLGALMRVGYAIDLVVPSFLDPEEAPEAVYPCSTALWLRIPPPPTGALHRLSRATRSLIGDGPAWAGIHATADVVDEVRRVARNGDVVVGFGAASSAIVGGSGKPTLLVLFSLPHGDLERAGASLLQRSLARRFEVRLPRRHQVVALVTPREQELLAAASGIRTIYLPFPRGDQRSQTPTPGTRPRLLFIADWNYPPNRDGLRFLLADVMPTVWSRHADVELVLAGKESDGLDLTGVTGPVRLWGRYEEVAELSDTATIAILPLLAAGGVRTRLIELLGAGLPVVATHAATAGMKLGDAVAAVPPTAFGSRLVELLDSPAEMERMRSGARQGDWWPDDVEVADLWAAAFDLAVGAD